MGHSDEIRLSDLKTIPNILSISRLVLIPAMLIPAYLIDDEPYARLVFLIMFIVIGITDKLDGTLARYLNQTTALGAKLDTIADMVFYPLIALWLYRFESGGVGDWWNLVYFLLALYFFKQSLALVYALTPLCTHPHKSTNKASYLSDTSSNDFITTVKELS